MTVIEKSEQLVIQFGTDYALYCIEEIREELLKQFNLHYPEETVGFWCNTPECKFWTEVKESITNEHITPLTSERWGKDYVEQT